MSVRKVTLEGVVRRSDLEGGLWMFEASDGTRLQLDRGGGSDLYKDGVVAKVTGSVDTGTMGIGMSGDILRVESYELR